MYTSLIGMAAGAALFAAVVAWAMARRYGRRRALVVPVLAIVAAVFSVVRADGLGEDDMLARVALAMGFAGPAVAGALVGLVLAGRKSL
jgi:phosphotransferase system  glucose/maltose/N-acetylglucosamine-specific IIC component